MAKQCDVVIAGVDIGFGATKVVALVGEHIYSVVFPSTYGRGHKFHYQEEDISARYPCEQLQDENGLWFVGKLAYSQLREGEQRILRGRAVDEEALTTPFRRRIFQVAMAKILHTAHVTRPVQVYVVSGLPVDYMADADYLKRALLGDHHIKTDALEMEIDVLDVSVIPQSYGAIYSCTLTDSGQLNLSHVYKSTGQVDIGTYTVGCSLDADGEYVDVASGSVEAGIFTAHERIGAALEQQYRSKFPIDIVDEVLRTRTLWMRGQQVNCGDLVENALEPLRAATLSLLASKWGTGAHIDVVLLGGGGATLVADVVRQAYPQTRLLDDPQLANARGYLNYARMSHAR